MCSFFLFLLFSFPFCLSVSWLAFQSAFFISLFLSLSFCHHFTFRLLSPHKAIFITIYARRHREKNGENRIIDERNALTTLCSGSFQEESTESISFVLCVWFSLLFIFLRMCDKMSWKLKRWHLCNGTDSRHTQLPKLSMKQANKKIYMKIHWRHCKWQLLQKTWIKSSIYVHTHDWSRWGTGTHIYTFGNSHSKVDLVDMLEKRLVDLFLSQNEI